MIGTGMFASSWWLVMPLISNLTSTNLSGYSQIQSRYWIVVWNAFDVEKTKLPKSNM